jgi:phenylalanyl-tRNA synthetase beta subunit
MQERLEQVGVRPINNVVDLSNYVMLEMGHPSHAFDLARVPSARLLIRWAREGEELETLDEVERKLSARTGVVAGPEAPLALAGIMGGASSEVSDETRTIALEAAYWDPLTIRRAAKALGMHTEASHRFERGADPNGTVTATARTAHLLEKLGAGTTRPGLIDVVPEPLVQRQVGFRAARANAVLGTDVPPERGPEILTGLGFELQEKGRGEWTATVPTWRGDVSREADLVEEIGRHHGLDKIVSTIPASLGVGHLGAGQAEERAVRDLLVGAGLTETINYAFVDRAGGANVEPVRIATFFPPGVCPRKRGGWPSSSRGPAGPATGPSPPAPSTLSMPRGSWSCCSSDSGRVGSSSTRPGLDPTSFIPGRAQPSCSTARPSAGWVRSAPVCARRRTRSSWPSGRADRFEALARFPSVERDLSVLAAAGAAAGELVETVREAAGGLLRRVDVKNRYDRPPVPAGRVSVLLGLLYQHPERTLTSEEVQASVEAVIRELRKAGLEIRGE